MTAYPIKSPRKLIEVALPLDAINEACVKEKNPFLKGHPRAVHLWWARRPLAAARAVIFAQLVNDPGYQQGGGFKYGKNKKEAATERKRLFKIIEDLVRWENISNPDVLQRAKAEILRSWREVCELNKDHPQAAELFNPDKLPAFHDPFAGGGAIPLEAQRLGLEVVASDLNPVAVLINKAMIEIPPKFAGKPPVHPPDHSQLSTIDSQRTWPGATGLAEDVRYYGAWMREEAQKRIGHLYPPVEISAEMTRQRPDLKPLVGQKLNVIAWLWVRTVASPNPAFSHAEVPLVSTFTLSNKPGREAYVEPVVHGDRYHFTVRLGTPPPEADKGTKLAKANFGCLLSGAPINLNYIRSEACEGRMGARLMAIVAEGTKGCVYLSPIDGMEQLAHSAIPVWKPDLKVTTPCHDIDRLPMYGMFTWGDAFTPRQLAGLAAFTGIQEGLRDKIRQDALASRMADDSRGIDAGGSGATAYAEAVSLYLSAGISQLLRYSCTNCSWNKTNQNIVQAFGRQALPMVWDFAEAHVLTGSLSIAGIFGEFSGWDGAGGEGAFRVKAVGLG